MGNLLMEAFFRAYIFLDKRKSVIITIGFVGTYIWGVWVYSYLYGLSWDKAMSYALGLFAVDAKTPDEIANAFKNYDTTLVKASTDWMQVYTVSIVAKAVVVLTVLLIYIREILSLFYRTFVLRRGEHTIVVGLGKNSRFFINSMLEKRKHQHKIIVFETDKENPYLETYKNRRVSIVVADVERKLTDLKLEKCQNIFISTGSDESNIYLAMKFMAQIDEKNRSIKKFIVHIEDRTLRNLYGDGKALKKGKIDLRTFSFYKESARRLFKHHPIDGDDCKIMKEKNPFNILIVGNSELTISLISEACRLSNLPNENKLTIYCIGEDMKALKKNLLYAFPYIEHLRDVTIEYIEADNESLEFYTHDVWHTENLTHIIYAENSVAENIRISTKVLDVAYVRDKSKVLKTKFHIATMNQIQIAEEIRKEFQGKNVFTFAEADKICSRRNLLFNGTDEVAKMVHYAYVSEHFRKHNTKITEEAVNAAWKEASVNDKRTSLAQVIHINTKLKALGLKRKRVRQEVALFKEENLAELYKENSKILNARLKEDMDSFGLTKEKLDEMEEAYKNRKNGVRKAYFFPKEYETEFEKLLRMEHNRWMTVLILMDNMLDERAKNMKSKERKEQKIHHLLKPFEDFKTGEERIYIINDIHTIKNMAKYLALTGYKIVDFDEN